MFMIALLYALFASVFTISKVGLQASSPLFLIGSRMMVAGFLMLGYQYFFQKEQFFIKKGSGSRLFQLALFNIYLTNIFEFWGLKYLTSFKTCFIYSLSPFLSALFSYFVLSEKLSFKKWIGLVVGFVGFFPILLSHTQYEEEAGQFFLFSWAELAVILAAISSVYGWILLGQLIKKDNYTPFMANGWSMFFGGIGALIHSLCVEDWNPIPVWDMDKFFLSVILLIIISNLICYNLYGWLLKKYSATFMSFSGFMTPLFAAFFGWLFLDEVLTFPFYVSTIVVFIGLFTFYQEELRADYRLKSRQAF
ncbi:S-adenosylmethionine/S-adenosylhomocysteine transporter [Candidatus Rubidus massiliensis]|nr:MAG: hypothetical protein BGO10_02700 [Chlamydia sp. 32-24]CDZ79835.1 S-adenosylmethionine/S-adenosylhomocysteine transporter [Candidatus Rubidus massiliensis]